MIAVFKKHFTAFMVALAVMVGFAAPSFAQAGNPISDFQSNAVTNAGLAVGLVVAVVLILSAVSLALWGLRKAGAGK